MFLMNILEWLFCRKLLAEAKTFKPKKDQKLFLEYAKNCIDLAIQAKEQYEPGERLFVPVAEFALYREAIRWICATHYSEKFAGSNSEQNSDFDEFIGNHAILEFDDQEGIDKVVLQDVWNNLSYSRFVKYSEIEREQYLRKVETSVNHLFNIVSSPMIKIKKIRNRILFRIFSVVFVFALICWGSFKVFSPINLADHKPWFTSSGFYGFGTKGFMNEKRDGLLFHTDLELEGWIIVDLQEMRTLDKIKVYNRTDCCSKRAIPVVVEISENRNVWKTVASKNEDFKVLDIPLDKQKARYIRVKHLSTNKPEYFHLEDIVVRGT